MIRKNSWSREFTHSVGPNIDGRDFAENKETQVNFVPPSSITETTDPGQLQLGAAIMAASERVTRGTVHHAKLRAQGHTRPQVWLSPEDTATLDRMADLYGSREAALREGLRTLADIADGRMPLDKGSDGGIRSAQQQERTDDH